MADQEDVLACYGANVEADSLEQGAGAIELERTKEVLARQAGDVARRHFRREAKLPAVSWRR